MNTNIKTNFKNAYRLARQGDLWKATNATEKNAVLSLANRINIENHNLLFKALLTDRDFRQLPIDTKARKIKLYGRMTRIFNY